MAYKMVSGFTTPGQALEHIRDYFKEIGWTILRDCEVDVNVNEKVLKKKNLPQHENFDGIALVVRNKKSTIFGSFRTMSGFPIFHDQAMPLVDKKNRKSADIENFNNHFYGIGFTAHTAYTKNPASGNWFDQPEAPTVYGTKIVPGVGMIMKNMGLLQGTSPNYYKLYFNHILDDKTQSEAVVITLVWDNCFYQHICLGYLDKIGKWNGGLFFSGTLPSSVLGYYNDTDLPSTFTPDGSLPTKQATEAHDFVSSVTPLLSESIGVTNTFLRIDIDSSYQKADPILWASNGPATDNPRGFVSGYTGLLLVTPNLVSSRTDLVSGIPHYGYLNGFTDDAASMWPESNNNELNGITVNLNLLFYVVRDPWPQGNFSPVGYVPGIYAISLAAVAPASTYEVSYPKSGQLHQAFPHMQRPPLYGYLWQSRYCFKYTGISIKQ